MNPNQTAYAVSPEKKGPLLRYLIETKNMHQVLIFTSSVYQADILVKKLNQNNIQAKAIHGQKSQFARTTALANFKDGKLRVLVATDILARGIDIQFLPIVINYELPRSPKDYIHRIGRTGRAGASGAAYSFCDYEEKAFLKDIEKLIGKSIPVIESHPYPMQQFHANKTSKDAGWGKPNNTRGRAPREGGQNGGQKRRFSNSKTTR